MNRCYETIKMGLPRAAQALAPRAGQPQGVGPEACLNGTLQGSTPEDAREDGHIVRVRCAPLSRAPQTVSATSGFPV